MVRTCEWEQRWALWWSWASRECWQKQSRTDSVTHELSYYTPLSWAWLITPAEKTRLWKNTAPSPMGRLPPHLCRRATEKGHWELWGNCRLGQAPRTGASAKRFSAISRTNLALVSLLASKVDALKQRKTKNLFPRSASPKAWWGGRWEDKHYFPYQIPASWAINNVIHSNLPQSASKNFLLDFVSNQKTFPENQSKYKCKQTANINKHAELVPYPPEQLPWGNPRTFQVSGGHSLFALLAAERCFLALDPDGWFCFHEGI